jgi:hypothetical protein
MGGSARSSASRTPGACAGADDDAGIGDARGASDTGACVVPASSGAHDPRYGAVTINAAVMTPLPPALRFAHSAAAIPTRRPALLVPFIMLVSAARLPAGVRLAVPVLSEPKI